MNDKLRLLKSRKTMVVLMVVALVLATAVPAFAQDPVTLDLDADVLTNGLFTGANIVIAALGAIMFILAGFKLGGGILRSIVDAVSGRFF